MKKTSKVKGVRYVNGNWWIDYRYDGYRERKMIGSDKALAESIMSKIRTQIAEDRYLDVKKEKKIEFKEFAKEFYELHCVPNYNVPEKGAKAYIKQLVNCFGDKYLYEIDTMMVEQFKRDRMQKVRPATVNRSLSMLKCMFYRAIDWGKFDGKNPVKKVKMLNEGHGRLRYLEKEEIKTLISNCHGCNGNLKPIVILAVNTGMRRGEIFNIKWTDIDFKRNIIHLYQTKNKEKREVFMNENVKNALIGVRKNPKSPYVFCYKDGQPVKDIRKPWFKALENSGIKDFVFHDLRHTFCSQAVMAGIDLNTVKELAGHKTLQMTLRYSHLSQTHKQQAVDILASRLDTKRAIRPKMDSVRIESELVTIENSAV